MRLPSDYTKLKQLEYLDSNDLQVIELKSKALSFEQCLDILGVELQDIAASDLILARKAHKRGRAEGIAKAADLLFNSMASRTGYIASMEYLKQMSGTFKAEATPGATGSGAFRFSVVLNDEEEQEQEQDSTVINEKDEPNDLNLTDEAKSA